MHFNLPIILSSLTTIFAIAGIIETLRTPKMKIRPYLNPFLFAAFLIGIQNFALSLSEAPKDQPAIKFYLKILALVLITVGLVISYWQLYKNKNTAEQDAAANP
jgi:hypothetical protein